METTPNPGAPLGPMELLAFRSILRLSEQEWSSLIAAISSSAPALTLNQLVSQIAEKTSISREIVEAIISTLATTHLAVPESPETDRLVQVILDALARAEPDSELRQAFQQGTFESRLVQLLENPSLLVAFKVGRLLYDHERALQGARVITEIRPIFDSSTDEQPVGSLVVHSLRVNYIQDGLRKVLFFAMTSEDVRQLRTQLNRAEAKEAGLRAALEGTAVAPLGVNSDE